MRAPITLEAKDPNEELAYSWTPQPGDTIAGSASLVVSEGTATFGDQSNIDDNATVRFVLSGGAPGEVTKLTAIATMASGDVIEQEIRIPIISSGRRCIDLALAKQHLEYEGDDRDALIEQYIGAAQEWVESYTGLLINRRSATQRFDSSSPSVLINFGPAPVVTSLTYLDSDLAEITIDADDYRVIGRRIYPVTAFPYARHGIEATITAGYAGDVPQALISAQLLLIGHWFANRETVVTGTIASSLPFGVEALCHPFRSVLV